MINPTIRGRVEAIVSYLLIVGSVAYLADELRTERQARVDAEDKLWHIENAEQLRERLRPILKPDVAYLADADAPSLQVALLVAGISGALIGGVFAVILTIVL